MIVYCPACGDEVEVETWASAVEFSKMGKRLEVHFQTRTVEHDCEKE